MKKLFIFAGMLLLLAGYTPTATAQVSNDNEDGVYRVDSRTPKNDFVPGQILVKFKDGKTANVRRISSRRMAAGISSVDAVLKDFNVEEMEQLLPRAKAAVRPRRAKAYNGESIVERDLTQLYKISLSAEKAPQTMELVSKLKALDEVEFAEPNYKMYIMATNDEMSDEVIAATNENPFYAQQWGLTTYGAPQLWDKPLINKKRPVIAIIDTGVDLTHPDLVDNLWTNTAEAEGEDGYDNDGNGFKNDVHGWDFINNTGNVRDNNMHGTHVAGIAAAANNGIGIIGANPQARIMAVSVMQSDGTGDVATIVKGIDYAVANGADVLNLSLGSYANSRTLRQALERAYQSTVIVAAAGNDGKCINTPHFPNQCKLVGPMFPAAYSFVLGVQATTEEGILASFSNYDDDENTFSAVTTLQDPEGFNYELSAPGTNILSTIPGGKYKVLQGTSMASPLVAGAVSALMMVKEYDSQEILWGDLLHTDNIIEAFNVANRPAELDLLQIQMRNRKELADETEEDYSGDHEIDAGETVSIYPVIRTTFGEASNIKLKLEIGDEFEDPNIVQILTGEVDFGWHLDAYGRNVSTTPLVLKVPSEIADGRHIKLKVVATCDESTETFEWSFTIVVTNMVKISGLITQDRTLTADHVYLVNENFGIMEGATLTIEPGTRVEFMEGMGLSSFGKLVANGTPEKPIVFTGYHGALWKGITSHENERYRRTDTLSYCRIEGVAEFGNIYPPYLKDCIVHLSERYNSFDHLTGIRTTITGATLPIMGVGTTAMTIPAKLEYCNIVNNDFFSSDLVYVPKYSSLNCNNYFNNYTYYVGSNNKYVGNRYSLAYDVTVPRIDKSETPSYLGTSREDIIRPYIWELGNAPNTFGQIDLSNMPDRPYAEPHGVVWKVCVNGKDAQDEFEEIAPLGVGRHKFEVWFNRPMNKEVAPQISFGVCEPYTQQKVDEDGSWNEEGTIYTAYKTISGKTMSDGKNRIYVYGAEDNEFFECPYEKNRFDVLINAAGSLATGFAAEAKMGRVVLTWNNDENDFDDAMGFNVYRYTEEEKLMPVLDEWGNELWDYDEDGNWVPKKEMQTVIDTICLNREIIDIETTEFTDYNVVPSQTYYYYYKVLSTGLTEYDVSNVVAATPLTATLGDANGSGDVDVADVITTVNYAAGLEPKPFIFEAADMNSDQSIDILDVIGIIQKILNPNAGARVMNEATAIYSIEDGTLYVENPVALAGVQVQLSNAQCLMHNAQLKVAEDLKGFEHTSAWLSDDDYLFLAYNMNGKTLAPGKHALLHIGNGCITSMRLSDAYGQNVTAIGNETTSVDRMGSEVMNVKGVYDLQGRKLSDKERDLLPKGIYIINGQKVVR